MPSWDDLSVFVDPDDFGIPVVVMQAGRTWEFSGIFDDPYLDTQAGEYAFDGAEPRVTAKESDMIGIKRGATCTVNGKDWAVMDAPKQDGTGFAVLRLQEEP